MKSSRENERKRVLWRILEGTHEDKKAFHLSPCCSAIPTNASSDQKGRPKSEERRSSGSVAILDFEVTKGEGKRNKQTALLTKGGQKRDLGQRPLLDIWIEVGLILNTGGAERW